MFNHRYRQVGSGDHADKGQMGGHCNRKACQAPGATWYNLGTDSYYCQTCATTLNECNRDLYPDGLCVAPNDPRYVEEK